MIYATLSADIVSSTSMSAEDTMRLKRHLNNFFPIMKGICSDSWGRIIRGDSMECVMADARKALRIALSLKCHVKVFVSETANSEFRKYGIRMALGIGSLRINDKTEGVIDGEAIYLSGRGLNEMSGKETLTIREAENVHRELPVILGMVDTFINKATSRQCEILLLRLQGQNEQQIAEHLGISQAAVNQQSSAASWQQIHNAVKYFESLQFDSSC